MSRHFSLFLLLFAFACGGAVPLPGPSGGVVSETNDPEQVRAALARALEARRFAIETETPGVMVARLDHGRRQLRVQLTYDGAGYRIAYVDSVGLGYRVDPGSGQPLISRHYTKYVTRLERQIRDELGRPAREAQEAIDQQREHELALERERTEREQARIDAENEERERQRRAETEQARLRTAQAQAVADAEYARHMPMPTVVGVEPVRARRLRFQPQAARAEAVVLTPGFNPDPFVLTGTAAGRTPSRHLGIPESCAGFWTGAPQEVLHLPEGLQYMRVDAMANEDVTLAMVTPDGSVYCDDDGAGGTNARLEGSFPPGTYAVYVGTWRRGEVASFALSLSERQSAPSNYAYAPAPAPAPRFQASSRTRVVRTQTGPAPAAPQPRDCRTIVLAAGHPGSSVIHCQGVDPVCAEAVIGAGHSPSSLIHCQGVDRSCAVAMMQNGRSPSEMIHCH